MAYRETINPADALFQRLNALPGTVVSAAAESIQVFHFSGRLSNLAVVVADPHPWLNTWRSMEIPVFSPEHSGVTDTEKGEFAETTGGITTTAQLLRRPATLDFLRTLPPPVSVLMFKPDAATHAFLAERGFRVIGCNPRLARRLENKMRFPKIAARAGLELPPYRETMIPRDASPGPLPMVPPFIVQFAKGFSGNRTFLIRTPSEWMAVAKGFPGRRCRVSTWLPGETWTANGCVMPDGSVIVSAPFLQETRIYSLTSSAAGNAWLPPRVGSRGNVWGFTPTHPALTVALDRAVGQLGTALYREGFTGFFGADLLVPENASTAGTDVISVRAVEVNPRITASASILTPIETDLGDVPLMALHLAAAFGIEGISGDGDWPGADRQNRTLMPGGQWIERGITPDNAWVEAVNPGVYSLEPSASPFERGTPAGNTGPPLTPPANSCLVWKPAVPTGSSERCRIIYQGTAEMFRHWLNRIRSKSG